MKLGLLVAGIAFVTAAWLGAFFLVASALEGWWGTAPVMIGGTFLAAKLVPQPWRLLMQIFLHQPPH